MKEPEIIRRFEGIRLRASAVGLTIMTDFNDQFSITDVPKSDGLVCFDTLNDLDNFIYGYERGYKSGL